MSLYPIIIAFSGTKSSGKSTSAKLVESYLDTHNIHRLSFSSPLKRLITDIFCLHNNECYDHNLKEVVLEHWNISPRELMQKIGTDLFRKNLDTLCPDIKMPAKTIWASSVYCKIKEIEFENKRNNTTNSIIIIDDCRFDDEYNIIKRLGGVVIKIKTHQNATMKIKRNSINTNNSNYNHTYIKKSAAIRDSTLQNSLHESENDCKYDYEIYNNESIEDLKEKLYKTVNDIMEQNIKMN